MSMIALGIGAPAGVKDFMLWGLTLDPGILSTPTAFSFTDQFNVPTGSVRTSNPIVVAGINVAVAISIAGDATSQYSKNGGAYTASAGTVVVGDIITVKHTASAVAATAVNSALTIGGVSDTFTSVTAPVSAPSSFAPVAVVIFRRQF